MVLKLFRFNQMWLGSCQEQRSFSAIRRQARCFVFCYPRVTYGRDGLRLLKTWVLISILITAWVFSRDSCTLSEFTQFLGIIYLFHSLDEHDLLLKTDSLSGSGSISTINRYFNVQFYVILRRVLVRYHWGVICRFLMRPSQFIRYSFLPNSCTNTWWIHFGL